MKLIIPKAEELEAYTQTANGEQLRIGTVSIWRQMFSKDDVVTSIDIQLDVIPIDGRITLRSKK